ncbi:MAG: GatB/YqeY domain-containing protein [Bacteroidetes bacterium]|nr:GatB/YqeY domain-containing protein [Bacteroidota bacterium]
MLKLKLQEDLKEAMKARDEVRLRTVRFLRAAVMAREIELRTGGVGDIPDEEAFAVLQKQAKQRRDSIEQFEAAGREDLKAVEVAELAIIEKYLPKQLSEEAVRSVVEQIVRETGVNSMKEMGKVMGPAMAKMKGLADGKLVQEVVKSVLSGS